MFETVKPSHATDDGICHDAEAIADKKKVMETSWYNSFFFSLSDGFKYLGGLMATVGFAVVIPALLNSMKAAADGTPGLSFGEAVANLGTAAPEGLGILSASAAAMTIGIGATFVSSRYFHTAQFDNMELNAQHTAKYLVKQLHQEASCVQTQPEVHEQNCRADGKQWQAVIAAQQAQPQVTTDQPARGA